MGANKNCLGYKSYLFQYKILIEYLSGLISTVLCMECQPCDPNKYCSYCKELKLSYEKLCKSTDMFLGC